MIYIIYKIIIADYVYIGSTKNYTRRKSQHKFDCNNKKDVKLYNTINELGGWDNCIMTPIEEFEADSNLQARIREEYFRTEYQANLNMVRCYRTDEQKQKYKQEYNKESYELNKIAISEKQKENYELNKIAIIGHQKEYYKLNKIAISEKRKEYREFNKIAISEKRKLFYQKKKQTANTI